MIEHGNMMNYNMDTVIIPPDAVGSKGDEAMLRGALNLFGGSGKITIWSPRTEIWKEWIIDRNLEFEEEVVLVHQLEEKITTPCRFIIIGADIMDGIYDEADSIDRLKAAKKNSELGGVSAVYSCSFRANASKSVIDAIIQYGDSINYYLRDKESYQNFNRLTGLKGEIFPDFAFFCENIMTHNTEDIIKELICRKDEGKVIIGINFNMHSFNCFYAENTFENRMEYVSILLNKLKNIIPNGFYVFISNDIREWTGHYSDAAFSKQGIQYMQDCGYFDDVMELPEFLTEAEMLSVLDYIDIVISGRMHLDIASMRRGVIPIAYYGNKEDLKKITKFQAMFEFCLGRKDLVVSEMDELERILHEVLADVGKFKTQLNTSFKQFLIENNIPAQRNEQIIETYNVPELFVLKNSELRKMRCKNRDLNGNLKWEIEQKELAEAKNKELCERLNVLECEKENLKCLVQKQEIKINNQHGHIEQLLEVDRHYQNMVNSRGWKLVSFPGRVFEKCFPVGTPRRMRVSLMVKYVKACNWNNIKFVCGAFKRGGIKQVKKELNDFEYRMSGATELPLAKPDVVEIEEITSIDECEKLMFTKYETPKVSIVIPVYNQFTYTYNCLKSILENSGGVSYEIIIADDVSNDLTIRLAEVAENINIVRNKENQRFLRNCNHAAQYAKGEYILFLNNDTQVQENWLQPLIDLIERDETIGMVGSKLVYPDGTLQEAGGIIWGNGNAWNYGNGQNPANPEFNYVKEVDYISGASIMIRTSLWKEIGGFDEFFAPAYCEDSDLAFEVRKHGYKLMYQPLSVVVHFEGKSNGTDLNAGVKQYQVDNSKKLKKKWKDEFAKQSPTEADLFHAKDRSQGKKTILVIDHYVPQFDKDAGSKTTWQYLKMFVKKGYNVKFIGDNFYQDEPYCTALQQEGIEVLYGPWYAQNYKQWIIDNQDNIDFVYLNRPHITEKYIDFLREETDIKCIYYGHDLHFLRLKREYELSGDEKVLAESEEWRKKEFDIMRKSSINYYPSYIEVDEIHKIDKDIPAKAITAYVYEEFLDDIDVDFAKKEGLLFVGGFGHPPNADAVIWFVENVYPLIRQKQDIPFYIVGSNAPDKIKKLDGKNGIIVKGFVSEEELAELYNTCKIVVVPLRYGAGVKGKVVEALYNGTPMVSTTVGIEGIPEAETFMEVADEAETFASKVLSLYNDNDRLTETVQKYQSYVKENNSIDAVWNIIKEDFQ